MLDFWFLFLWISKTSTSPCLEGVSLCGCIFCVHCLQLVTLAGWLRLEWVQAWDRPGEVLIQRLHKNVDFDILAEGMMFHSTVLKPAQNCMCLFRKKLNNITIDYMWVSSWMSPEKSQDYFKKLLLIVRDYNCVDIETPISVSTLLL